MPVKGEANLASATESEQSGQDAIGLNEDYNRIATLAASLTRDELLTLDVETILRRLFWEEKLMRFVPQQDEERPRFACTCSRERVGAMLVSLGIEEVDSILEERGMALVAAHKPEDAYAILWTLQEKSPAKLDDMGALLGELLAGEHYEKALELAHKLETQQQRLGARREFIDLARQHIEAGVREEILDDVLLQAFHGVSGPARFRPFSLKFRRFTRTKQVRSLKPPQERPEIWDQLNEFAILQRTGVHKIQHQVVPEKNESVFQAGLLITVHSFHPNSTNTVTPLMNLFIG